MPVILNPEKPVVKWWDNSIKIFKKSFDKTQRFRNYFCLKSFLRPGVFKLEGVSKFESQTILHFLHVWHSKIFKERFITY